VTSPATVTTPRGKEQTTFEGMPARNIEVREGVHRTARIAPPFELPAEILRLPVLFEPPDRPAEIGRGTLTAEQAIDRSRHLLDRSLAGNEEVLELSLHRDLVGRPRLEHLGEFHLAVAGNGDLTRRREEQLTRPA
jgi:hypothetical protein